MNRETRKGSGLEISVSEMTKYQRLQTDYFPIRLCFVLPRTPRFRSLRLRRARGLARANPKNFLTIFSGSPSPPYSASKVALRFYTESLRSHLQIIGSKIKIFELLPPVVATRMADNLDVETITPTKLVQTLIDGLTKDRSTIRVGNTKLVYLLSRLSPKLVFNILNSKKNTRLLKR